MTDLEFEEELNNLNTVEYREEFEAALQSLYVRCSSGQREGIRSELRNAPKKPWKYPTAYGQSDLPPVERIHYGLIGMSMSVCTDREDILSLASYYEKAKQLGMNPDALLEEVAELSDVQFAELVRAYASRWRNPG